jgi:pimeloyl-ACP methyl ester carboxylesterase
MHSVPRLVSVAILALVAVVTPAAFGENRMISIGDRRPSVYCDGEAARSPTVVLIPAGGRTAKDWATIQPVVSTFTRVCSYDQANFGESDKAPVKLQSIDEVVDDLHGCLKESREKGHFILVSR